MAKGFISINTSKSGRTEYYTRKEECEKVIIYNEDKAKKFYKFEYEQGSKTNQLFRHIEKYEKNIRVDARVKTTLIVSLPNDITADKFKEWTQAMQKQHFSNVPVSFCLHTGKSGEVSQNKHCHILFSERDLTTGKKDRKYHEKGFVQKIGQDYKKYFSLDIEETKISRERIDTGLWKSDSTFAREQLKHIYTPKIENKHIFRYNLKEKFEEQKAILRELKQQQEKYIWENVAEPFYQQQLKSGQIHLQKLQKELQEKKEELDILSHKFFKPKQKIAEIENRINQLMRGMQGSQFIGEIPVQEKDLQEIALAIKEKKCRYGEDYQMRDRYTKHAISKDFESKIQQAMRECHIAEDKLNAFIATKQAKTAKISPVITKGNQMSM